MCTQKEEDKLVDFLPYLHFFKAYTKNEGFNMTHFAAVSSSLHHKNSSSENNPFSLSTYSLLSNTSAEQPTSSQ